MKAAASRFWASVAGLTHEEVALILTLGVVLGVFPVIGCPTVMCAAAALALRLNLPAIQLVNQLSSPLQLALLIPLVRAGARILGNSAGSNLASAACDAVVGWCCVCLPVGVIFYLILLFMLHRYRPRWLNGLESPS